MHQLALFFRLVRFFQLNHSVQYLHAVQFFLLDLFVLDYQLIHLRLYSQLNQLDHYFPSNRLFLVVQLIQFQLRQYGLSVQYAL